MNKNVTVCGGDKNNLEILKNKLEKSGILKYKKLRKDNIKRKFPELYKEIIRNTEFLDNENNISFRRRIYHIENNLIYIPKCPVCNNKVNFNNSKKFYFTYCSIQCRNKCPEIKESNSQKWWNKSLEERKAIQDKIEHSFLNNYGAKNVFHKDSSLRNEIDKSIQSKYGVKNVFQLNEAKEKSKNTNFERHGYKYNLQRPEIKSIQKINKRKYIFRKIKNHCYTLRLYVLTDRDVFIKNGKIEIECKNGHKYEFSHFSNFFNWTKCPLCGFNGTSGKEKEVQDYVRNIIDEYIIFNDKRQILNFKTSKYLELDIWIPRLTKAIEFNGDYWHCFEEVIERDSIKKKICNEKNINLLIVEESQWENNTCETKQEIKSFLKGERYE